MASPRIIIRGATKTLLWTLLVVVLLVCSIYVPPFQQLVVRAVLNSVNSNPDVKVEVESFRLRFPLTVEARGVEVYQRGDTMLLADNADVRVALLPLLKGEVDVKGVEFERVFLKIGNPDSAMWLRGQVDRLMLDPTTIKLSDHLVEVGHLALNGGRVDMIINQDTTPPTPPSVVPWHIIAPDISLSDVDVNLKMLPAFERISGHVGQLKVAAADINLSANDVSIDKIEIDGVSASLMTPATPQPSLPSVEDPFYRPPMTIAINSVKLFGDTIVYGVEGAPIEPGLDFNRLQFTDIVMLVDSVYNRGNELRAGIGGISMINSTGVPLTISGKVSMDSIEARAKEINIQTNLSKFDIDAVVGMGGATASEMPVDVSVEGYVSPADVQKLFPGTASMVEMLPPGRDINVVVRAAGTMAAVDVDVVEVDLPRHLLVKLSGRLNNLVGVDGMSGRLKIEGNVSNADFVNRSMSKGKKGASLRVPPLQLSGDLTIAGDNIGGNLRAKSEGGDLALDAKWNGRLTGYDVDVSTHDFPVNAFMPGLGVGRVSLDVKAKGQGLDVLSRRMKLNALVDATDIDYNGRHITDLTIKADIADGIGDLSLVSVNDVINATLNARGNLSGDELAWVVNGDVARLDLEALGMSDTVFDAITRFNLDAAYNKRNGDIKAILNVPTIDVQTGADRFYTSALGVNFSTTDTLTTLDVLNHDLSLNLRSDGGLSELTAHLDEVTAELSRQIETRNTDVKALQEVLPHFDLNFVAGQNNILSNYLADSGINYDAINIIASNGDALSLDGHIYKLVTGEYDIDDLHLMIDQSDNHLRYSASINNKPGTMDNFANVNISGELSDNKLSASIRQSNLKGEVGYNIGAVVAMTDSTLTLTVSPENPTIGYKPWHVNPDNFIMVNTRKRHIDANLIMSSAESSVSITTMHDEHHHDGDSIGQEPINLLIKDIKLQEWLALSPFAPPIKGNLSADISVYLSPDDITGKGTVTLADLIYGKQRVGTFDLDVDVSTNQTGALYGQAALAVDGRRVMEAHGNLNDTTAIQPFLLDMTLERLPLALANPFIGAETGSLSGYLNGEMDITGSMSEPRFNGYIQFDSTEIRLKTLGSALTFTDHKIPVDSNIVMFKNYPIYGVNDNPLLIDGEIDARHISNIGVDMTMKANDMQIVGAKARKGAEIYGNAFISLDASAKGNLRFIRATADLTILPGTNVTYVVTGGVETITSRSSSDMVRFVNFNDTASVAKADTIAQSGLVIDLNAMLHIAQGSTIAVDLSPDGLDKVSLQSEGTLDFSMDYMGDTRLTGRLNIDKGMFRYNPPVISMLNFDFVRGSYITFNGALLNPQLNVNLEEKVRANVSQEGVGSRMINFIIGLGVTGTLNNMNVAFDLSTDDDITVANELQSMSAEQRANQAMNLLLYGSYTGVGTKASTNTTGNPIYSFLESQLNNWMARNVKAVDISFGMDQYDNSPNGTGSTTTSYSYKVSKTFLNDRFKIVVGGNYTTDADPDENLSQNLINDISFEYMLNRAGSMYVRLFRHTGYESILEGEVTQTGVGFVYRRKLRSLSDMFKWVKPGRQGVALPEQGAVLEGEPSDDNDIEGENVSK